MNHQLINPIIQSILTDILRFIISEVEKQISILLREPSSHLQSRSSLRDAQNISPSLNDSLVDRVVVSFLADTILYTEGAVQCSPNSRKIPERSRR
jgi:hypothetical protein